MQRIEPSFPASGLYIDFEGPENSGKTTQLIRLHKRAETQYPGTLIGLTIEPGGSEIAASIREALLRSDFSTEMEPLCAVYLFAAARAQNLPNIVRPVLERKGIQLQDRNFFSSGGHQGYGDGLGAEFVLEQNRAAITGYWPHRVYLIDVPKEVMEERGKHRSKRDRLDRKDPEYHRRVRDGYLDMAAAYPDIFRIFDGNQYEDEVHRDIWQAFTQDVEEARQSGRIIL